MPQWPPCEMTREALRSLMHHAAFLMLPALVWDVLMERLPLSAWYQLWESPGYRAAPAFSSSG